MNTKWIFIGICLVLVAEPAWAKKSRKAAPSPTISGAAAAAVTPVAPADNSAAAPGSDTVPAPITKDSKSASKTKAKSPRKPVREKDTEGSEAADRFEKDTVIKSPYQLNGEQLEVDPD